MAEVETPVAENGGEAGATAAAAEEKSGENSKVGEQETVNEVRIDIVPYGAFDWSSFGA